MSFYVHNIVDFRNLELYVLIEHKIWSEVQHPAVDVLIGPPSEAEHHHPHPWILDDSHLVVHMEISKT